MAAYDPRAVKGLGVTYATSPMGADHTAGFVLYAPIDHHSPKGQAAASRSSQVVRAALDALGLCNFVMSALLDKAGIIADLVNAVQGTAYGPAFMQTLGEEVLRMERAFNAGAGFTKADDRLPEFVRSESLRPFGLTFDVPQEELDELFDEVVQKPGSSGGEHP